MNISEQIDAWKYTDTVLAELEPFWQIRPFDYLDLPWRDSHPQLCAWLDTLTLAQIEARDSVRAAHQEILSKFFPAARALPDTCMLPELPVCGKMPAVNRWCNYRMSERKWQQILAFTRCAQIGEEEIVEWCSGKGHLGRLVGSSYQAAVTGLEKDPALCQSGALLAERLQTAVRMVEADVMEDEVVTLLHPHQHVLALHACGQLHTRLLKLAVEIPLSALTLAPCCYHAISTEEYHVHSQLASTSALRLSRFDLKLALQETVVAGKRVQRARNIELNWRLGFDLLRRDITGDNHYRTLPSVRRSVFNGDFRSFCRWAARRLGTDLPPGIDYDAYQRAGAERRVVNARIELIRHLFRLPLEFWLLADRAAYLHENGFQVELGTFCARELTPRNSMIRARLI